MAVLLFCSQTQSTIEYICRFNEMLIDNSIAIWYNCLVKYDFGVNFMLDVNLIGKRIKELRRAKGLTQNAFAEELHVSFQAVSNWERGIAPPELENLIRIAAFFDVLVDDLLRPATGRLLLGIDGGGTKTEFAVVTPEGHVLKRFVRAGSNPNDIGTQKMISLILDGVKDALIEFPSVASVFCGIAGISTGENRIRLTEAFRERYPIIAFDANTDSANLFAMDDSADMVIISGTGSVVFVRQGDKFVRVGGWGYLLDNGGSAYDIGRDALQVALYEEDTQKSPCRMTELLREKLGTAKIWDSVNRIYSEGKPFIASLAECAFAAYREGDSEALSVIEKNTARLADLLNIGIKQYGARPRAVAGGGVFEHYLDIMTENIGKHTETELISVGLPQIYGACRRALLGIADSIPEDFYDNFKNTY